MEAKRPKMEESEEEKGKKMPAQDTRTNWQLLEGCSPNTLPFPERVMVYALFELRATQAAQTKRIEDLEKTVQELVDRLDPHHAGVQGAALSVPF
jgi:hypothetical protein